jgi:hypothetical protein
VFSHAFTYFSFLSIVLQAFQNRMDGSESNGFWADGEQCPSDNVDVTIQNLFRLLPMVVGEEQGV